MSFKNLSLSKKLIGAFVGILIITGLLGGFAINRLKTVNDRTVEITSNWMPSIRALGVLRAHLTDLRIGVLQHLLTADKAQVGKWEDVIKTARADLEKDLKQAFPTPGGFGSGLIQLTAAQA